MGMSICTINHGQEYLTGVRVKLFSIIKLKKLLPKDCVPLNNLVMIVQTFCSRIRNNFTSGKTTTTFVLKKV